MSAESSPLAVRHGNYTAMVKLDDNKNK